VQGFLKDDISPGFENGTSCSPCFLLPISNLFVKGYVLYMEADANCSKQRVRPVTVLSCDWSQFVISGNASLLSYVWISLESICDDDDDI